jgi:hypothetical protein
MKRRARSRPMCVLAGMVLRAQAHQKARLLSVKAVTTAHWTHLSYSDVSSRNHLERNAEPTASVNHELLDTFGIKSLHRTWSGFNERLHERCRFLRHMSVTTAFPTYWPSIAETIAALLAWLGRVGRWLWARAGVYVVPLQRMRPEGH